MTDVSFTTIAILAVLFFSKYLESQKGKYYLVAVLFCVIAVLMRQMGLLLPIAFIPALILMRKFSLKNAILSLIPFLITFLSLEIFVLWVQNNQVLPPDFGNTSYIVYNITHKFFTFLWDKTGIVVFYLIAISLPFSFFGFSELWLSATRKFKIATYTFTAILLIIVFNGFYGIPVENIAYNLGIGPRLLKDTYWGITKKFSIQRDLQNVINFIILLTILPYLFKLLTRSVQVTTSVVNRKASPNDLMYVTFISFIAIYSIFLIFNNWLFDRYFLPIYPFILAMAIPVEKVILSKTMKRLAVAFAILVGLYSFTGTHDFFSWSNARWKAASHLVDERNVSPASIDGGFEFNGWNSTSNIRLKRALVSPYAKSWWFVEDDQYIISGDTLSCYCKVKGYPFSSIFPKTNDSVYALERKPYSDKIVIQCNMESFTSDGKYLLSTDSLNVFYFSGNLEKKRKRSGENALLINKLQKSKFITRLSDFEDCEKVKVSFWKYPATGDAGISIKNSPEKKINLFEKKFFIEKDSAGWVKIETEFTIPAGLKNRDLEFSIYNIGETDCLVDDFELIRQKLKK
jgi:hypothetical protein